MGAMGFKGASIEAGEAFVGKLEDLINWSRGNSLWYFLFATACCGIELMQSGGPRTDLDRFGMIFRASPRQSDVLIVAGTITYKMATRVRLLWEQMAEPKWVVSMGSCANCGGLFDLGYSTLRGVDKVVPVDVYVPGCPPRPEALTQGLLYLQNLVKQERPLRNRGERRPYVVPAPAMPAAMGMDTPLAT